MKLTKTVVVLALSVAAGVPASASLTSRSYVQKGLVAQYDGINNAGTGSHDSSATTWKNLTGDTSLDGTCDSKLTWNGSNGWTVSGDCKPVTVGSGLAQVIAKTNCTIEVACKPSFVNKRFVYFGQYNGSTAYRTISFENTVAGKYRLFRTRIVSSASDYNWTDLTPAAAANTFVSFSFALANKYPRFYQNGSLAAEAPAAWGDVSDTAESVIGGEPWASSNRSGTNFDSTYKVAFNGTYHAFRVYDRVLTDAEVKVNAAVDAIRFNGANPADFTLSGGYSFDDDGDLCVDVSASGEHGTVAIDGGAARAAVKQHDTVTLKAKTEYGYAFVRWEGAVDAITSGKVNDAVISVTPSAPVALTAVFAPASTSASYLYVNDGLVAMYDGINNAGTGTHSPNAKTWANLTGDSTLDGACDSKLTWNGSNGWSVSGDCKPVTVGAGLASVMSQGSFAIQFACKPSVGNKRECFFGQYAEPDGISIEHNWGGSLTGILRWYRNKGDLNKDGVGQGFDPVKITANQFASVSAEFDTENGKQTFRAIGDCGNLSQTATKALGQLSSTCESVIGGEVQRTGRTNTDQFTSGYGITFQGTYHAFRLYDRVLTDTEVAWNAGLDAVRFNGATAAATFGAGYSYDAAKDELSVAVNATATTGGKIKFMDDEAADAVAETAVCGGGTAVTLVAVPDAGYVFDCWSGETSCIAEGSFITPEITLVQNRPVTLVAHFRRNGDAADGLVTSVAFTGDSTADGVSFSTTQAESKQGYTTADVTLPVMPAVTNTGVHCLYFPSPSDTTAGTTYRQDARLANRAVTGSVATLFVRFRWDGSVQPAVEDFPTIVMNGYTSWNNIKDGHADGFAVRLRVGANATTGYPTILVPKVAVGYTNKGITTTGTAYITAGKWVDMFVSVYPSPTDDRLSNADIWYCETPAWNDAGYFAAPKINHRHFGDACGITNVVTTTAELRFGCEPNPPSDGGADVGENAKKAFRGVLAGVKGWNRLLTENEMWTVMAGFDGVQTFDNGRLHARPVAKVENLDGTPSQGSTEGRNVTSTSFLGDAEAAHFQRSLTTTYNAVTLLFDAPKGTKTYPYRYKTKIENVRSNETHPIHLDFNGKTVWSSAGVAKGDEITVELAEEDALPGLNTLTWHYDTEASGNWLTFNYHSLKIMAQAGLIIILR